MAEGVAVEQGSEEWQSRLREVGLITQDSDVNADRSLAEARFNEYVGMLDSVTGIEAPSVLVAVIDSICAGDDYGALQPAVAASSRFPPSAIDLRFLSALLNLFDRKGEAAVEVLCPIADSDDHAEKLVDIVRSEASAKQRPRFMKLVAHARDEGWIASNSKLYGLQ